ncbi:M16 family metallopeptidase [Pontibacter arcticus]|uniref:Insulinase family protein n=1 Tax=Pontibacter arcticus TaxID=2080288 RepID=A0A364RCP2_9BACT|nr:pitrilysin family protein [Pontibacter arcticus]RAU82062.1 insulinase family protein [Pontibacter arcticus]
MLDRTKAPEVYDIDTISLQQGQVTNLPNGANLHIIKSETQPVIRLDFVFKAGKWYDQQLGVSDLTAKMLFEGTKSRTAKQIAETIAFYGASFESNHGYDRSEFTLYCLAKHVDELLPLVFDVLQNPSFPSQEFELLKERTIQGLKVQREKNNYLATHQITKQIYGEQHPYIYGFDETAFDAISLEQIEAFYKQHFQVKGLEVFACGSIDDKTEQLLISGISAMQSDEEIIATAPTYTINSASNKYELVHMPESIQSSIRVGKQFPVIQHKDYLKLILLNEVLGGYFGSRLMRNIREDKGYTYGIHSAISPKETDTLFYIGTDVNSAVTANTIEEIKKEISLLQQEEIPEDELQTVKNYMLGKFLNDINTIFDQCDRYKRLVLYRLPVDHYSNYVATIKHTTAQELLALAKQYLSVDDLYISVAGPNS